MKILIDTNVLLSAFVFGGAASLHLKRLIQSDDELIISSYVDEEFKEKLEEKWPQRAKHLYSEFHKIQSFHFVDSTTEHLASMRDKKDDPILSDALFYHADIILTGDKDFLEGNIERPLIMSPRMLSDFLDSKEKEQSES